jgi:2-iminoacetate synthase
VTSPLPEWLDVSPWLRLARRADRGMVRQAVAAANPGMREFAILLSAAASGELETLAARAQALTRRHFGRTIGLYAPLYLSNYCPARCTYCGFASDRKIQRHKLTPAELAAESAALKRLGLEEVLLLTGDRLATAGYEYVRDGVERLAAQFHSVSAEVFAMTECEYAGLAAAGCTAVTLYQETYDPARYALLHESGPKADYAGRLDAPARALAGGIRSVGLGVLLGLSEPLEDVLRLFCHAARLRRRFWAGGMAISFPRIRPQSGDYAADFPVSEAQLAQIVFAFRIAMPDAPLILSTRESPRFRDGMAGVGISKMSVASRTTVGGYAEGAAPSSAQFEIEDHRGVDEFCAMLRAKGLQPVLKNWDAVYRVGQASGLPAAHA